MNMGHDNKELTLEELHKILQAQLKLNSVMTQFIEEKDLEEELTVFRVAKRMEG